MLISEKLFYRYFVLTIALMGFLISLYGLIFEDSHNRLFWMMLFLYTLYFAVFWNHKKTGETSAFRRDAFFIAQFLFWPYTQ